MMSKIEVIMKGDHFEYLKATEYFVEGEHTQGVSHWTGDGAAALGLAGKPVEAEAFENILGGKSPTGKALTKNANSPNREKLAVECVNSAPKSVSMLMAFATPEMRENIVRLSEQAHAESMKYLGKHVVIRTGHNGEELETAKGICVANFTHRAGRDLTMQLHHHGIFALMAQREDGTWASLDSREVMDQHRAAGAVYRSVLARGLAELGFKIIADDTNDFSFRIEGFSREAEEEFSKGSKRIADYIKEHNLNPNDPKHVELAAKKSRSVKDEPPFAELLKTWRDEAKVFGINEKTVQSLRHETDRDTPPEINSEQILDSITNTRSVFERKDVLMAVANEACRNGGMSLADVEKATDRIINGDAHNLGPQVKKSDRLSAEIRDQNNVISVGAAEHSTTFNPRPRTSILYSSIKVMRQEIGLADDFAMATSDTRHNRTTDQVQAAIKAYEAMLSKDSHTPVKMKAEQIACMYHCANGGRQLGINGLSGTGKSFCMAGVRLMEETAGQRVIGTALAGQAAASLKEGAGINEGGTLASVLIQIQNGKIRPDFKTTFILDEAAMTGVEQFRALQLAAPDSKIIVLGDKLQYQNIERGAWFGGLQDLGIKFAELKDIVRQKLPWHKEAVLNLKDGRGAMALQAFADNDLLVVSDSTEATLKRMALDYVDDTTPDSEKPAMCSRHRDTRAVNDEIRRLMIERGQLSEDATWVEFSNKDDTARFSRELRIGDRLRIMKGNTALQIFNGNNGELQKLKRLRDGDTELTLKLDSGKTTTFRLSEFDKLDYGYCGTGHASQGLSKHHAYTYLDPSMVDKQAAYVLASRSKQETKLYMSTADTDGLADALSKMGRAMSRDGSSDWVLDYLTPEQRREFTAKYMDQQPAAAQTQQPTAAKTEPVKIEPEATQRPIEAAKEEQPAPIPIAALEAATTLPAGRRRKM
ncbi:MobF family relaxase [Duganella sp. PWIR1]